ncbi:MAG: phosphate acyltransferase PlsX [Anaerolineae bacterium]
MKIALDAMGGDYAPQVTVEGGVLAAQELGLEVILVGRKEAIRRELAKYETGGLSLSLVHASQVIEMEDKPATAVKAKKDSSMVVGMDLVKKGEAQAFVSAGNSGGVMVAALFRLGRIKGIQRPALCAIFVSGEGPLCILDVGANTDCKPLYLLQFAIMGSVYMERVLGVEKPRVGIISTGEEEGKGSQLVLEAYELLKRSGLNFIGNVEGKDVFFGLANVVVTDGFTGNVMVKLAEGVAGLFAGIIEEEIKRSPLTALGGLLAQPAFRRVKSRLDYSEYGGVPLLGVGGVVIVAHGRSNAKAIKNALRMAKQTVEGRMIEAIKEEIERRVEGERRG